ncbi:hypothetical protein RRG08_008306 [Elysia crispata]|uniref:Uncharacterized protein n=1 Tax=Elysia crispata TaxID=231223 RepID=A0AAE0ZMT3_9GAST|nr:hypothetical protein RRG08_008306 [Elysia crispata]
MCTSLLNQRSNVAVFYTSVRVKVSSYGSCLHQTLTSGGRREEAVPRDQLKPLVTGSNRLSVGEESKIISARLGFFFIRRSAAVGCVRLAPLAVNICQDKGWVHLCQINTAGTTGCEYLSGERLGRLCHISTTGFEYLSGERLGGLCQISTTGCEYLSGERLGGLCQISTTGCEYLSGERLGGLCQISTTGCEYLSGERLGGLCQISTTGCEYLSGGRLGGLCHISTTGYEYL